MTRLVVLSVVLWLAASTTGASNFASLGYSDETTVVGPGPDACAEGTLIYHHDGSFENGYAFDYGGVVPPYYGAFGEGYDLGPGVVTCGAYWLSTLPGYYQGEPSDCYIWQGGVYTPPGTVLGVAPDIVFDNIPVWPAIGQNDIALRARWSSPTSCDPEPRWTCPPWELQLRLSLRSAGRVPTGPGLQPRPSVWYDFSASDQGSGTQLRGDECAACWASCCSLP
jgi:hypothetical protein